MPPETVLPVTKTPVPKLLFAPLAVIVPVFVIPPPIVLLVTASATVLAPTSVPGLIVPALATAPVTVEPLITIEVVALPAGFVTVATVWFVIVCPAFAGAARRSAATEVVTRREVVKREWRDGGAPWREASRLGWWKTKSSADPL